MFDLDGPIPEEVAKVLAGSCGDLSDFRKRAAQTRTPCPKCETQQVELVGAMHRGPAGVANWRCRHCKHDWETSFVPSTVTGRS